MSAEILEQPADLIGAVAEPRVVAAPSTDRAFWKALAVAALLHASLFISVLGARTERLGEEGGSDDAINVSLVTEADFLSRTTVPEKADAGPGLPAPPQPQAATPTPPPPPELKQTLQAEEPPAPPVEPPPKPEAQPPKDAAAPTEMDVPDLFLVPDPAAAKAKAKREPVKPNKSEAAAKPAAKAPPQQKTAKLDLSPPKPTLDAPPGGGGRSAGFSRPPGITRSGANDDFARAVIRALQQTMPQLRETLGRVTVKIVLNENGNVKEVLVMRPSPDSNLNQSVVFAARQTSYPFPPVGSNEADRVFLVTYIYN